MSVTEVLFSFSYQTKIKIEWFLIKCDRLLSMMVNKQKILDLSPMHFLNVAFVLFMLKFSCFLSNYPESVF